MLPPPAPGMPYLIGNRRKSQGGATARYRFLLRLIDTYSCRANPKKAASAREKTGSACPVLLEVPSRSVGGSCRFIGRAGKDIGVPRKAPFSGLFGPLDSKRSLIMGFRVPKRAVFPPKKGQNARIPARTWISACPVLLEAVENDWSTAGKLLAEYEAYAI